MSSWGYTGRVRGPGAVAVRQQGGRLSPSCPEPASPSAADVVDENIGEYCSLDKGGKRPQRELTTGEKEQLFLEAMMVRRRSRTRFSFVLFMQLCCAGHPVQLCDAAGAARQAARHAQPAWAQVPRAVRAPPPPPLLQTSTSLLAIQLQSYYYDGQPMLSDEEFENLKQELQWEGSKVVVLRCAKRMSGQMQQARAGLHAPGERDACTNFAGCIPPLPACTPTAVVEAGCA